METLQTNGKSFPSVHRLLGLTACAVTVALILASCASVPRPLKPETTAAIGNAINSGSVDRLLAMSSRTFAFDGEVFDRSQDISTLWNGLVQAGMKVNLSALPSGAKSMDGQSADQPVTSTSYKRFSDSKITDWFFSRHVPPRSRMITLETNLGSFLLVASDTGKTGTIIYGLAGPVK